MCVVGAYGEGQCQSSKFLLNGAKGSVSSSSTSLSQSTSTLFISPLHCPLSLSPSLPLYLLTSPSAALRPLPLSLSLSPASPLHLLHSPLSLPPPPSLSLSPSLALSLSSFLQGR